MYQYGANKPETDDDEDEYIAPSWEQSHAEWLDNPRILMSFGDDWIPGKYRVPGTQVPSPPGYHRAQAHEVTRPVLKFANQALRTANPEKLPQDRVIGKRVIGLIENLPVVAQIEWHLDNHPPRPNLGIGPMEGDPFYHMGVTLYMPNDPAVAFGFHLSFKVALHGVGHFASNIVKTAGHEIGHVTHGLQSVEGKVSKVVAKIPVIGAPIHWLMDKTFHLAMAPTDMVVAIADDNKRINHVILDELKSELKTFKQIAPYAEMVVSLVPGVGQGIGAAIAAGVALSEGQPITEALKAGLIGAIPGGPLVQAAVATGVETIQHIAKGERIDLNTFAQTAAGTASSALGLPPAANHALVAGFTITGELAKGAPLDKSLSDAAVSALPISDTVKRAMTEASTLTLELTHGKILTAQQSARIATLVGVLPVTNPLHASVTTGLELIKKNPLNSQSVMLAALHSGLGDTLISMGAQTLPSQVQKAVKSGNALGSAIIYQEHRRAGLSRVTNKLIESGTQHSKHHPVFAESRKLAAHRGATRGHDYANGLLQHKVGMFDVVTARNSLDEKQRHGFDIAAATRVGLVANPRPPMLSPAAHAGYVISLGMQSHEPDDKMAIMQTIQQNPSASVGATVAVKEIAATRDSWWIKLLRFLGLHK